MYINNFTHRFPYSRGAIRATDIFVVRYDADNGQANLRKHTDASHLSFNVLLNDEFEGGGTRFHSRVDGTYYDVKPDVGEGIISHAEIQHEGLATTKGTRYILVGFGESYISLMSRAFLYKTCSTHISLNIHNRFY